MQEPRNDDPGQDTDEGFEAFFDAEMEIGALASTEVIEAPADVSIRDAARRMGEEGIGLLVLRNEDGSIGVLSERDILQAVALGIDTERAASEVGNGRTILRATPETTVGAAATEMMRNYVRHVLIVGDDGAITGVVSVRDLLAVLAG